jgi:TonB-dependent receptor
MRLAKSASRNDSFGVGKAALKLGASLLVLTAAGLAAPAMAQDDQGGDAASADGENAIVVTGFREALRSAQGIKQNADTIVDSVTAEDIGALPDRSVTETLQRIPGISINRFSAGVDPDHFSAEGAGVVVRGLTYVRSEFNGREAFTANNGRALGFQDVPSELLGRVDVVKSPSADRIEGGIAGTVDLRTRLPLDNPGLSIAGSLEANYSDFIDKWSPTGAIVASNTWDTGIGEIGLLASFSYSQLYTRADRFQLSSFRVRPVYSDGTRTDVIPFGTATQTGSALFPRGAVEGTQEFNRERYGYSAAAQWRSNDGRAEATFQFLRSDSREAWTEYTVEIATDNVANNGDSRAVAGTSLEFDSSGLFDNGTITGPTGWRADQQVAGNFRTPILGLQSNNIRRDKDSQTITSDYSANFKYDITDNLALNLDYQHAKSSVDIWDNTLWISTYQDASIDLNGSDFPTVAFQPPQNCNSLPCPGEPGASPDHPTYFSGDHNSFSDPYNSFYRSAMDHRELSDGNLDAFRADLDYQIPDDDSFLKAVTVGGRYADRDQVARFSTYNWGVLSEQWGNGGPVWLDDPVDGTPGGTGGSAPQGYETFCFDNFFRDSVPNPMNGDCRLFYGGNTVDDYQQMVEYANQINREWQPTTTTPDGRVINAGWRSLYDRPNAIAGTPFTQGEINPQREKNKAAYVMLRFGKDFDNGSAVSGNVGLRYTSTHRFSEGNQEFLPFNNRTADADCASAIDANLAFVPPPDNPDAAPPAVPNYCALTATQKADIDGFANGAVVANNVDTNYDYVLPSLNVRFEVNDSLQFRVAYSKGLAPPDLGLIRNYFPVALAVNLNTEQNGTPIPIDIVEVAPGTGLYGSNGTIAPGQVFISGVFNAGNPDLKPIRADNYDLTAEWYFSNVGQLTASLFYKRLEGVLTNNIVRREFTNNGVTFDAVVTSPVNSTQAGKIKGFEVAYQQVFDFLPGFLSGLGLQANYTYVDSQGVPQSTLSATDPDVAAGRVPTISGDNFPLQGLSKHQINITPFIDIGPFSARASYNWRSRYLLTLRDVITPFDPIFQEDFGQLDASITYSINDHFKVGIQGYNLLNSITKTSAAVEDQNGEVRLVPRGWYVQDRRYSFVARFNF